MPFDLRHKVCFLLLPSLSLCYPTAMEIKTLEWKKGKLYLLDQTKLPLQEVYTACSSYREVAAAIRGMVVRGAPAIGVAAAFGLVLGAKGIRAKDSSRFRKELGKIGEILFATRPTAVNLLWAVERMKAVVRKNQKKEVEKIKSLLEQEAVKIWEEDLAANRAMGKHGQILIPDGASVLTHCNAGALATAGYGTALGVIRAAFDSGKKIHVFVDETRPFLQGARLTSWELMKEKIPSTLITDSMAGALMAQRKIDVAIVGADRIAANGDVANKIGTYTVALLCHAHKIPFYVAAPVSTIDLTTKRGEDIPIEQRSFQEVTSLRGQRIAPFGAKALNPAFDVTPYRYIHAIITERGIAQRPFSQNLKKICRRND
jgi:methylthioribose-1-phosphate isomerase